MATGEMQYQQQSRNTFENLKHLTNTTTNTALNGYIVPICIIMATGEMQYQQQFRNTFVNFETVKM